MAVLLIVNGVLPRLRWPLERAGVTAGGGENSGEVWKIYEGLSAMTNDTVDEVKPLSTL